MKYYFIIQFKRITRLIKDNGINPYIAVGLSIIAFIFLSSIFFERVKYPEYLYLFVAFFLINSSGNKEKYVFLNYTFSDRDFLFIKIIENFIIASPFALFMLFKGEYLSILLLYTLSFLSVFIKRSFTFSIVIPTPFFKHPFEFIVGFRKTYLLILAVYLLAAISCYHSNFNLGIFSLVLPFLIISFSFYTPIEPSFYVWVYSISPQQFLISKIKTGTLYSILMSLPIALMLFMVYRDQWLILMLAEIVGLLFVLTSILGKYAYYPSEINIIQGFALGISLLFPPLLLLMIPIFYIKAKQNLNYLLQ